MTTIRRTKTETTIETTRVTVISTRSIEAGAHCHGSGHEYLVESAASSSDDHLSLPQSAEPPESPRDLFAGDAGDRKK